MNLFDVMFCADHTLTTAESADDLQKHCMSYAYSGKKKKMKNLAYTCTKGSITKSLFFFNIIIIITEIKYSGDIVRHSWSFSKAKQTDAEITKYGVIR